MRILFLTHRLPYAPNRGDRIRALSLLEYLRPFAQVDLVSLVHDDEEASHAGDLAGLAASVRLARTDKWRGYARAGFTLATHTPLTHVLLDAPDLNAAVSDAVRMHPPDVVLAYCSSMARLALAAPLRDVPCVLDMVDVDSEKWKALSATARWPLRWIYTREGRHLATFEALASRHARTVLVVSEREREALLAIEPTADVRVIPVGVSLDQFRPVDAPSEEPRVTFCGVMNYPPNEAAVIWMANAIWPLVRQRLPGAQLSLVGANPPASVQRLASQEAGIEVTGTVPDVRPYLWRSAVSIAPLQVARGVQNKVLEAIAAGLPAVVTPAVLAGLPEPARPACVVASDAAAFADATVRLLETSAPERRAIADRVDLRRLSWPEVLAPLRGILQDAVRSQSAKRARPSSNVVAGV